MAEDMIPKLVLAIKGTMNHPDDPNANLNLINAALQILEVRTRILSAGQILFGQVDSFRDNFYHS